MEPAMKKTKSLAPVKRNSLTEQVTIKLRQAILDGRIKTGERIIEEDIAAMMKTSRGPVRDALIELEHEGLVIRERNRGAMVVRLSAEDVEEVMSLRIALENLALRYAMERATEEDWERMQEIVREITAGIREECSLEKGVDLDLKFHEELVAMSRHRRLISYWQGLRSQIWFLIFSVGIKDTSAFSKRSDVAHRQLLEAMRAKDYDKAALVLKRHTEGAYLELARTYRELAQQATT
jgi:DNA-binding GntR family transcriptional regulator